VVTAGRCYTALSQDVTRRQLAAKIVWHITDVAFVTAAVRGKCIGRGDGVGGSTGGGGIYFNHIYS